MAEQQSDYRQTDNEAWRFYSDDQQGPTGGYRGLHAGDTRAAVAPYLAHHVRADACDKSADFAYGVLAVNNRQEDMSLPVLHACFGQLSWELARHCMF